MLSPEAQAVQAALIEQGLETPLNENVLTRDQKVTRITELMAEVVATLGLDLNDDSLHDTPQRIARMYVDEVFAGLDYHQFPKISQIDNKMGVDEMIRVRDIAVLSTCEHHFVTIDGLARVAYLPRNRVIGLSKINRIVRFFAQRPQVQERLTHQILVALQTLLEVDDVAVQIQATHYCVKARGVMDVSSETETLALGGVFKSDRDRRREFLAG
ncbi:GTP cyclohydrolase I FolE [Marinobacter xestospongiae]|uniref:GTP cyclohydrolase I FolE n=1 Tax=Marinobacter xestospongiae TaxID=994319 RepID=UPI002003FA58|nr:GTP cyclohydrolase I FolE [Marinobacter xestospongiae]MCK7567106.1 GTP cyclohydrolase I FolE [Marinobacter xestospongiae]